MVEDLPLAAGQAGGMDHSTYLLRCDDATVDAKLTKQHFSRHALFAGRRILRDSLPVATLQNLVSLQGDLQAKGMVFNKTDAEPFREALRKAGFYGEWKEKYGAEAWGLLEKAVGALA